ncbi:hypothetical protein HLB23_28770 [Nocardia uniformis]|uniref:Uncharacterized protein n=1 Tax=Nocardia uniformis TaxID=53432 RepID=A0A849CBR9_9NOCA|nr:hypothetical protein [Nocardia uniformis]NNH73800.1 hypothetical protein [Nocardia uniformis]
MGLIWIAAVAALAALLLWWAFPTLARIAGFLLAIDSLLAIVLAPARSIPGKLPWLALGLAVWLAGHWAYAFKHGAWASPIALRIFALPGLHWMIPRATLIHFDDRDYYR